MFCKLALSNIKKSFKDYTIYFMTLIIAISMFYVFNSLDTQSSMLKLTSAKNEMVQSLVQILSMVSVFVAGVLGYLVIYANNFLIRRRKKEFGLYQTLGMSKWKISLILFIETLVVGVLSLLVGSVVGIFLSQGLSVITGKLFDANLNDYHFVFSKAAFTKTLLYFTVIYGLVFIFNIFTISRYKLIDLLSASKKNEKMRVKSSFVKVILFIASIVLIGYAYKMLLVDEVVQYMDEKFLIMLCIGALGTYLLFVTIAGFALQVVQNNKKIYYNNLNTFVLRQLNNKINTTTLSITVISLMLLLTITIMSCSMSLISAFNTDIEKNNITDLSLIKFEFERQGDSSITESIKENDLEKYFDKYSEYTSYSIEVDSNIFFEKSVLDKMKNKYGKMLEVGEDTPISVMKSSEYNKLMELYSRPEEKVNLNDSQFLLVADMDEIIPFLNENMSYCSAKIGEDILKPINKECVNIALFNCNMAMNITTIIVNDDIIEKNIDELTINNYTLCANYVQGSDKEKIEEEFLEKINLSNTESRNICSNIYSKQIMQASSLGTSAMIAFIGMYLGMVFSITSAAILAIGQLSESADNKERYAILRRIGVDDKMINKALFTQILIYFGLPLIVATIHSVVALKEASKLISLFGEINLGKSLLISGIFVFLVYGIYFMATYLGSKSIVKEKERYID